MTRSQILQKSSRYEGLRDVVSSLAKANGDLLYLEVGCLNWDSERLEGCETASKCLLSMFVGMLNQNSDSRDEEGANDGPKRYKRRMTSVEVQDMPIGTPFTPHQVKECLANV